MLAGQSGWVIPPRDGIPMGRGRISSWLSCTLLKMKLIWGLENAKLIFDGTTLTKAPPTLTGRQNHAAQAIKRMWLKKNEKHDPAVLTWNRYGVQLGVKVPLWGGMSGQNAFPMKFWTDRPTMTR